LKTYQRVDDSERFEKEARAWAALSGHPAIARLSWFGRWESGWATIGLWYPATLSEIDYAQDSRRGLKILGEIAEGLAYAVEDRGVLHRDLKPANDRRGG
jgi:serine/threonine protein kinase